MKICRGCLQTASWGPSNTLLERAFTSNHNCPEIWAVGLWDALDSFDRAHRASPDDFDCLVQPIRVVESLLPVDDDLIHPALTNLLLCSSFPTVLHSLIVNRKEQPEFWSEHANVYAAALDAFVRMYRCATEAFADTSYFRVSEGTIKEFVSAGNCEVPKRSANLLKLKVKEFLDAVYHMHKLQLKGGGGQLEASIKNFMVRMQYVLNAFLFDS